MYLCMHVRMYAYTHIYTAADFSCYVQVPFSWQATVAAIQKENCEQTSKGYYQAKVQHKEMPRLNMHNNSHFVNYAFTQFFPISVDKFLYSSNYATAYCSGASVNLAFWLSYVYIYGFFELRLMRVYVYMAAAEMAPRGKYRMQKGVCLFGLPYKLKGLT